MGKGLSPTHARLLWLGLFVLLIAGPEILASTQYGAHRDQKNFKTTQESSTRGDSEKSDGGSALMNKVELAKANLALSKGIHLDDQENDFSWAVDGFNLPAFDLKSVTIGVDKDFLYIKYQLFSEFNEVRTINSHTMTGTGFNADLRLVKDLNIVTPYGIGESTLLGISVSLNGKSLQAGGMYLVNIPNGLPESDWQGYGLTKGGIVKVAGGNNVDWVLASFALKDLGVGIGDAVIMSFATESGSTTEFHLVIDPLLGYKNTKCSAQVHFILGQSSYTLEWKNCEGADTGGLEPVPSP